MIEIDAFAKNRSSSVLGNAFYSQHTGKGPYKGSLSRPWNNKCLWVHPPPHLYQRTVQKFLFEGCSGLMIVPVRKNKAWWWTLGEITPDWIDIPSGSKIFQGPNGDPLTVPQGDSFRLVYFDSIESKKVRKRMTKMGTMSPQRRYDSKIGLGMPP